MIEVRCDCCKEVITKNFYRVALNKYEVCKGSIQKVESIAAKKVFETCPKCTMAINGFIQSLGKDDAKSTASSNIYFSDTKNALKRNIYEEYISGVDHKELAEKYNLAIPTVMRYIETFADPSEIRWTKRKSKTVVNNKPIEEDVENKEENNKEIDIGKIMALYNAKWSIKNIAGEVGISALEVDSIIQQNLSGRDNNAK